MSLELDLADFTLPDEGMMEIKNKQGEPSGWRWRMAGPGHPATIAADDQQTKRYLRRTNEQERARVNGKSWKGESETVAEIRERSIAYIIARIIGWNDDMTLNGKAFPFTAENARTVLANQATGIYDQANEYLRDEQSFMKASARA